MTESFVEKFQREREELNSALLEDSDMVMKRFFSLDSMAYRDGALPASSKELLGLTASLVLRCDDCIAYHLGRCRELGLEQDEVMEAMGIGVLVGGSITIPHLRRAVKYWRGLAGAAGEGDDRDVL